MGIFSWIIFGAIAGFVAGQLSGSERSGCLYNVVIGVLGALLGGFLMQFVTGEPFNDFGFNFSSFVVAILGSIVLLFLTGATRKSGKKK